MGVGLEGVKALGVCALFISFPSPPRGGGSQPRCYYHRLNAEAMQYCSY